MDQYDYSTDDIVLFLAEEGEADDCANCPYASPEFCKNQCMEVQEAYNPNLRREK